MTKRIWELDALRGICILAMVAIHLIWDLQLPTGPVFGWVQQWGGIAFFLIAGICVTLGRRPVKRGALVLGCGMLCTAVTAGMYALRFADKSMIIWFGVLHCLGACMLLWPVFCRLKGWLLAILGTGLAALGLYLDSCVRVSHPWLVVLGVRYPEFASADYFPVLPFLGFFLLGAALGRALYPQRRSLLPQVNPNILPLRFLSFCGRHSLVIYLLHQPALMALTAALNFFQE